MYKIELVYGRNQTVQDVMFRRLSRLFSGLVCAVSAGAAPTTFCDAVMTCASVRNQLLTINQNQLFAVTLRLGACLCALYMLCVDVCRACCVLDDACLLVLRQNDDDWC